MEIKAIQNVKIPKIGKSRKFEILRYPPIKLMTTTKTAENRMPICLCFKRPLTSLGEHQNAPKQSARPISNCCVTIPKTIGIVTATPIKTALEKLVLLKNSNNSLMCFEMSAKIEIVIL